MRLSAKIGGADDFQNAYVFDGRGRMTSVVQQGQSGGNSVAVKRVEFAYDEINRLIGIDRYESLSGTGGFVAHSSFEYDFASRLTALAHDRGATALAAYAFEYDNAHRLTQFTSLKDAASGGVGSMAYRYDDFGQLLGVEYANWLVS